MGQGIGQDKSPKRHALKSLEIDSLAMPPTPQEQFLKFGRKIPRQ